MTPGLLAAALAGLLVAAAAALFVPGAGRAWRVGGWGTVLACALGTVGAVLALGSEAAPILDLAWPVPGGRLALAVDPLSAWFLIPTFLLGGIAALHGLAEHGGKGGRLHWAAYAALVASMATALCATNGVLFVAAWEGMAVSSFLLVAEDGERAEVRDAAWVYLVASQLGAICLVAFFVIGATHAGGFAFEAIGRSLSLSSNDAGALSGPVTAVLLVLAFLGFGTKAGLVPLHVWLPEAHPAAPSHVSALLSGAMIKTGLYGLFRIATWLPDVAPSADVVLASGGILLAVGAASALVGALFALAQHDLKRLLAYSSVENVGIVALALGASLVARAFDWTEGAALAAAAGLLHVLMHALFKGLLFLGAGSVLHACGEREMDRLGGLGRRMPWTSAAFCAGSVAICALPPMSGFASEFMALLAALRAWNRPELALAGTGMLLLATLPLVGGIALAAFAKAFGISFLGEPRTGAARGAQEAPRLARAAMLALVVLSAAGGLGLPWLLPWVSRAASVMAPGSDIVSSASEAASGAALVGVLLVAGAGVWLLVRSRLLRGRRREENVTWDCGFAEPTARMQITGSSFSQALLGVFARVVPVHARREGPSGYFPIRAAFASHLPALFRERLYRPIFVSSAALLGRLRGLQHGQLHWYVLYLALALAVLIAWKRP